jgi:hypothetical protein
LTSTALLELSWHGRLAYPVHKFERLSLRLLLQHVETELRTAPAPVIASSSELNTFILQSAGLATTAVLSSSLHLLSRLNL